MKSKHIGRNRNERSNFSAMLEESFLSQNKFQSGSVVPATVTNINNKDYVFVETSGGQGVIVREELLDRDGKVTVGRGEKLFIFFSHSSSGENIFTTTATGKAKDEIIRSAYENKIPLKGDIVSSNKGGYDIKIGELIAFCPMSQMDQNVSAKTGVNFLVTELSPRKIIVSHRAYKDAEKKRAKDMLTSSIHVGDILTGTVKSIQEFGIFVDVGGWEGLVPLSELDFHRVVPKDTFQIDQEVRVKVMSVDRKEDKLGLSIRALLANPWQGSLPFKEGTIIEGVIDSLKPFGVFVKIPGNFTGLIPNSESGVAKGQPVDKHFVAGESVRVMVFHIDREKEKIALSVKRVVDADSRKDYEQYMNTEKDSDQEQISSFGKALMESLQKKK